MDCLRIEKGMLHITMSYKNKEYFISKVIPENPTTKQTCIVMMRAFKHILENIDESLGSKTIGRV